jgi:hypothetical protein
LNASFVYQNLEPIQVITGTSEQFINKLNLLNSTFVN